MEDKKQDVNSLEELFKVVNAYSGWFANLADELSKVLADIQTSKKEEDAWKMKCPYKEGDEYWSLCDDGHVYKESWGFIGDDDEKFEAGHAFPTKEAALLEAKRRNLLTRFRAFRNECNGDWKPDWGSYLDLKNYICCAAKKELKIYRTGAANDFCIFGYFKNEQDAQRAIDLFGDEIIELFVDCEGE